MANRFERGEATNDSKAFSGIDIPVKRDQILASAEKTAQSLIDNPVLLGDFLQTSENARLSARAENNFQTESIVNQYLISVQKHIEGYDWSRKRLESLTPEVARSILINLPQTKQAGKKRPTVEGRIIQKIARGYLNDRFESSADWKSALLTEKALLEAALDPEPDLEMVKTWFNIQQLEYPDVIDRGCVYWRSVFIGCRMSDPELENYATIAFGLDSALMTFSGILGERHKVEENSKKYLYLNLQVMEIQATFLEGLDPRSKKGRDYYQKIFKVSKSVARNGSGYEILNTEMKNYTSQDFARAQAAPITEDLVQLAYASLCNPTRSTHLAIFLNEGYDKMKAGREKLATFQIQLDSANALNFPEKVFFGYRDPFIKITKFFDHKQREKQSNDFVERALARRGEGWKSLRFSLRGLNGYILVKSDEEPNPQETVAIIDSFLKRYEIEKSEVLKSFQKSGGSNFSISFEDVEFIFHPEDVASKSQLESLLDLNIEESLRNKAYDFLNQNLSLSREIPTRFTRIPTRVGDKYSLFDHTDLPNVIDTAVIRKSADGELEFVIDFRSNPIVNKEGENVSMKGSINFQHNRVNFVFREDVSSLPVDEQWIIKNILLHLVERSCCPELREVEEEVEKIETQDISSVSIPGYIGHVGGYRADGTRKQFTTYAENNFAQAVASLYRETGVSLAEINRRHQEIHSGKSTQDTRYLTYYKGRDVVYPQEPTPRKAPDHLIL